MSFGVELLFFNDINSLKRSIPTYIDFVDHIIAIDGRHTTDKEYKILSDDGSREYLKSIDKVTLINMFDYEAKKRIRVKEMCKDLNIENLLIIDSDEYVRGDWNEFLLNYDKIIKADKDNINLYKIEVQRYDYLEGFFPLPILFRSPWEFTYYKYKHSIPIQKKYQHLDNIYAPISYNRVVKGIQIMHDHSLRNKDRMDIREHNIRWFVRLDL